MNSIQRWNRGPQFQRASELAQGIDGVRGQPRERLPIEPLPQLQNRFQDRFEELGQRFQDGFDAPSRKSPESLGTLERLLTSKEFQERFKEAVEGTSSRAQQAKQVESTYKAFWKDSQDFSVSKGPSLTVPEPPRYEAPAETAWKGRGLTVPEFQAVGAGQDTARVERAAQASAALQEARRVAAVAEHPFTLLGRAALRG
ncbi:hypothetical protein [Hyalangium gracile]|uniref:hypothetical protein n=1 Tax=Hyalangium gracile TaxID=394092 RepID=UPI001CC9A248|nr:hypothetical protein [Hyalangium gracile]